MADLDAIADWIGQDSPARALAFVDALEVRCKQLAEMPLAWPTKQGRNLMGARVRVWQRYLIIYVVLDNRIDVLHVINGARDIDQMI